MTDPPGHEPDKPVHLDLVTLGGAGLYTRNTGEPVLGPGKPLALLVYLALTPGRRTSREFLMDLLWADLEPERARSALRQALFHLRRVLGEDAMPGTEELTLVGPINTDRDRFLAALERGDLEQALETYGGEFLPSFGVPGGAAFEQWADLERGRLRAAFLRCAELLVRRQLNQSRFREAQRLARRVRDEVPQSEAAWRLLLETIVAGQDFVAAAVEAEALERWASTEGVTLEPATRLAVARARQVTPPSTTGAEDHVLVAELIGREREFSAITSAWEAARTGPARHLHLKAPAGFGKSRLLRDAVARLQAAGARVVELRGTPGDRDIPFAFAGDLGMAIAELPGAAGIAPASAAALVSLNPAISARLTGSPTSEATTGEEALRRRVQALTDLVQSVAHEQAFVLVIDDLHWLDGQSFRVLDGVLGRLNGAHVLCLTAARPECLPGNDGVTLLPLAALTSAQVTNLVSALGTIPADAVWGREFVAGLHQAAGGSPLLVLETLRLAMDEGMLALDSGEWRCPDANRLTSLLRAGEALRQRIRALPRDQAWVLALLATAGTPLPLESAATVTGRPTAEMAEVLGRLERQGLASRTVGGWLPAHDEIAAAGRDALAPADQAAADRAVGKLLIDTAGTDTPRLLRGIRHLAAAGDDGAVGQHFRQYAQLLRQRGDRRLFSHLAAEVLGTDAASTRAATLVQHLPALWRLGLWSPARQALALATLVLLAGGATAAFVLREARAAGLQRLVYMDSTRATRQTSIHADDFDGRNTPLGLARGDSRMADAAAAFTDLPPAVSPDGRSVAWNQDSGDSTTIDIWIRTPTGTRRLTHQARDDLVNSWLPDGSGLIGMTNRWSPPSAGNYDIAVFDTATGLARPITGGPAHEGAPFVSPDGTRIAFIREIPAGPPLVCVTPFDGQGTPECRAPGGFQLAELLGWSGPVDLVLTLDSAGTRPLFRYDWPRDERTLLAGPQVYRARLSPDRRWIVAAMMVEGIRGFRDWIIPIDRPSYARQAGVSGSGVGLIRWWEGRLDPTGLIDRIEFTDTNRTILLGISTRLAVRAFTAAGTEVPVLAPMRWRSSDTLVAAVDVTGDVRPRASGEVTIEASLAGWRTASRRLTVVGRPATVVLDENWDDQWTRRWIAFGDPAPQITIGPGMVRAFWNRGDGTYQSMAVLRQAWSAREGLGMEVKLSTPVGRSEWQRVRTRLAAGIDTAAFRNADPWKASPSQGREDAACGAGYPDGSGSYGAARLAVLGGISGGLDISALAEQLRSGRWWTLRLQILPDGRCGVAIDHRVIWVSPQPIPLDGEFRLRIGDESAGSKLLHGPLQVWTGVRTDIDWSGQQPGGR